MTDAPPTVLITGAAGQLGEALRRSQPTALRCVAVDRDELDIGDAAAVETFIARTRPRAIINAAAYTAVDRAEQDADAATTVNAVGPGLLAAAAARHDARLVQISTDFVFDGAAGRPYRPQDATAPLGVYARSKRDGEQAALAALPSTLVLRTAWLYSAHGNNFVKTMLRLMRERDTLRVVADQIGTPTSASGLAEAVWRALTLPLPIQGIHHWTDAGTASWYDFAVAIAEDAAALGMFARPPRIVPIRTQDYPTPAPRPPFSVLDKTATWDALQITPPHWRVPLRVVLQELKERGTDA